MFIIFSWLINWILFQSWKKVEIQSFILSILPRLCLIASIFNNYKQICNKNSWQTVNASIVSWRSIEKVIKTNPSGYRYTTKNCQSVFHWLCIPWHIGITDFVFFLIFALYFLTLGVVWKDFPVSHLSSQSHISGVVETVWGQCGKKYPACCS